MFKPTEPADCLKAAKLIEGAFSWTESPQGYNYWDDVVEALENFSDPNRCQHCGRGSK